MSGGQRKNGNTNNLRIFAGRHTKVLAGKVCDHLGIELGDAKTFEFPDGELLVKIDEDVRGRTLVREVDRIYRNRTSVRPRTVEGGAR